MATRSIATRGADSDDESSYSGGPTTLDAMTGPQRAAVILLILGEEHGRVIWQEFDDEEIRIIRPTVEKMRAGGVACEGPIPSDIIFLRALRGEFDGVVMMYHDQGQIATKLLGFNKGVTVTAGLKTVFATPAHGTAFDIVGKGQANAGGIEYAFRLAAQLAAARRSGAGA